MAIRRSQTIRHLYRLLEVREVSYLLHILEILGCYEMLAKPVWKLKKLLEVMLKVPGLGHRNILTCSYKDAVAGLFTCNTGNANSLHSTMLSELTFFLREMRFITTQAKVPPQTRQMGALKVSMVSPGIVYEPYKPRDAISFLRRWFTRSGWRRTKEDIIMELKNAYAIAKLRKISGYSKHQFYQEAVQLYKEINSLIANGDQTSLRKAVTESCYSALKNEIKQRKSMWSSVYWELVMPVVKMRTLRARMIGIDKNDLNKAFIQLTIEFLTKQKFEAYNSEGAVVSGDKTKEVLVRDIWVFERSLFHPGAYWRLCGRLSL